MSPHVGSGEMMSPYALCTCIVYLSIPYVVLLNTKMLLLTWKNILIGSQRGAIWLLIGEVMSAFHEQMIWLAEQISHTTHSLTLSASSRNAVSNTCLLWKSKQWSGWGSAEGMKHLFRVGTLSPLVSVAVGGWACATFLAWRLIFRRAEIFTGLESVLWWGG